MAEQYANDAATTLNGAITNVATSLVVTSATGFPTAGDFRIRIGSEILKVTAVSGTTFTVERETEDATRFPKALHSSGDAVNLVLTAASLKALPSVTGSFAITGSGASGVGSVVANTSFSAMGTLTADGSAALNVGATLTPAGAVAALYGAALIPILTSAQNVTALYGAYAALNTSGYTGAATSLITLQVIGATSLGSGGTATNAYAILAASPTVGTNKYGIAQTGSAQNSFAGPSSFTDATSPIVAAKLGPATTQQHTLPAVTSDTVALIAATQTLTNKTLNSSTNTIGAKFIGDPPCARAYNQTTVIGTGAVTAMNFSLERFDTDTIHDNTTNNGRLTATTAGKYLISLYVAWPGNVTGERRISIRDKNGTEIAIVRALANTAAGPVQTEQELTTLWDAAATDWFDATGYQTSGGNLTPVAEFMMVRL